VKKKAIIFDLDDTLTPDHGAVDDAMLASCERVRKQADPAALAESVWKTARALWNAGPMIDYCRAFGLASCEGLQGTCGGDGPKLPELREWMPGYRREVWTSALAEHGIRDDGLVRELSAAFPEERRVRYVPYEDVMPTLEDLQQDYRFAMLTNGIPTTQREKLAVSGLDKYFPLPVISGNYGIGKPDPRLYHIVLDELSVRPVDAVMVGNSPKTDIPGALATGILAVQIQRGSPERADGVTPHALIKSLDELRAVIE